MPRIRTLTGRTERHRNKMQARLKRNYEEKRRQKELSEYTY